LLQRSTRLPEDALAYAALEWVLIALLLINGLLAYTIAVTREPSWHGDVGATCGLSCYVGMTDT
jgi:hypothetical protein